MTLYKNLSIAFAAGALGGLLAGALLWLLIASGVAAAWHVHMVVPHRAHTIEEMFYREMIWGGVFGLLMVLPILKSKWFIRGLVYALVPFLVMGLWIYPSIDGIGYFGVNIGHWAWALILIVYAFWGIVTALWYRYLSE